MALKSKIILGVILGVFWVALCVVLALIPKSVPVEFGFSNTLNANLTYNFSMKDYVVRIEKNEINKNEIIEHHYEGFLTEKRNGGIIEFTEASLKETALNLDVNIQDIDFLGQSYITAYKTAGNYMVLFLNGEYVALTNDSFTDYSNVVGAYSSSLKTYKNPDIDLYILKNETNLNQKLYNEIYAINSNGDVTSKFFNGVEDVKEITYNDSAFVANELGTYALKVKYGEDKTITINVCVYSPQNSPDNKLIEISSSTMTYHKTHKNDVNGFLNASNLKIKFKCESAFKTVTSKMIKGLDTRHYGVQVAYIEYNNTKYYVEIIIDDEHNTMPYELKSSSYFFVEKQGEDTWLNKATLTAKYFDKETENNIKLDNENVEIDGFDKNSLKKQIVTISYKGQETRVLVVVLNSEQYENYLLTGEID